MGVVSYTIRLTFCYNGRSIEHKSNRLSKHTDLYHASCHAVMHFFFNGKPKSKISGQASYPLIHKMQLEPYGAAAHIQTATVVKNCGASRDRIMHFGPTEVSYLAEGQGNETKEFVISINA